MTEPRDDRGRRSAISQAECIADWYAIAQFAREEIEGSELTRGQKRELRDIAGGDWDGKSYSELLESTEERVREDALSVEVRSDWHTPGEESTDTEYTILLSTGGPACRIIGDLNRYGRPGSAKVQFQDWFAPWDDLHSSEYDEDALLWYASQFYWGEG
jgi:hypothetical protein